jgi:hypothetical protein
MADTLDTILQSMRGWNWAEIVEIVKGGVSIWVAIVATLALKTWKRQSKAQKQTDFMDEITNSVHEFVAAMSAPIEMLKYIKIGIESHARAPELPSGVENAEAVAYIQKHGKEDSKKLLEYLNFCHPSLTRIRFLSAKGQVLGLKNYEQCQNTCTMLTWQHERIQALCYIIGNPSLYWQNPEVQKTLSKVIQLDPEEIRRELGEHSVIFLTFVKENYRSIFK